jgi:hypothetical protein
MSSGEGAASFVDHIHGEPTDHGGEDRLLDRIGAAAARDGGNGDSGRVANRREGGSTTAADGGEPRVDRPTLGERPIDVEGDEDVGASGERAERGGEVADRRSSAA